MIAANYNIKKGSKDLVSLSSSVQNLANRMKSLDKAGNELEYEVAKLGKVTSWTERSVKELKNEVKHVNSVAKNGNHRKVHRNGNGRSHKVNAKYSIGNDNGNGNDNGKHLENVLVKEKTV